jgi:hypothetical protein
MVLQGPCGCGKRSYVATAASAYGLPFVVPESPDNMGKVLKYCVAAPGTVTSTGCVPLTRILGAVAGKPTADDPQDALLARLPTVHYFFGLEADEDPRQATAALLEAAAADALMPGLFVIALNEFPFPLRALRTCKAATHVTLPSNLPDLRQQAIAKAWRHVGAAAHATVDADLMPEERADLLVAMGPDGRPVDGHPSRVTVCRSATGGPVAGFTLRVRVAGTTTCSAGNSVTAALRRVARGRDPVWQVDAVADEAWVAVPVSTVLLGVMTRGQVVLDAFREVRASRRHAVQGFLHATFELGQGVPFGATGVPAGGLAALDAHLQGLALDPEDTQLLQAHVLQAALHGGPAVLLSFGPGHVPDPALNRVLQYPRVRLQVVASAEPPDAGEAFAADAGKAGSTTRVAVGWEEAALDHAVLARVTHTVTNMPAAVTWLLSALSCPAGATLDTEWTCVQTLLEGWGPSVGTTFWGCAMNADGFQGIDWAAVLDTRSTADLEPFYAHTLSAVPILQARDQARRRARQHSAGAGTSASASASGAQKITVTFKDPMCWWHSERQRRQEAFRSQDRLLPTAECPLPQVFTWREVVEGPTAFTPGSFVLLAPCKQDL